MTNQSDEIVRVSRGYQIREEYARLLRALAFTSGRRVRDLLDEAISEYIGHHKVHAQLAAQLGLTLAVPAPADSDSGDL